ATIYLREGDVAVIHAQFGEGGSPLDTRRALNADWITGRAILEARTIHVPDLLSASGYPQAKEISLPLGYRTLLAVPLMRTGLLLASFWQLGGKYILSPKRKFRFCRTSPHRRSLPSRTRGF